MNKILKNKAIVASLIVIALFLVSTLVYFSYSKNQDIILGSRGSLPYYDYVYSVLGSEIEIGTLEREYGLWEGAFIVKIIGAPMNGTMKVDLQPGSPEDQVNQQSGSTAPFTIDYYTMQAKVIEIVDNRSLENADYSQITLSKYSMYSLSDPLYLNYKSDPEQEFLIFVIYDEKKDVFNYSVRAAYYVQNDQVFSTNNTPSIDSYSGMSVSRFAEILKQLKPFSPD